MFGDGALLYERTSTAIDRWLPAWLDKAYAVAFLIHDADEPNLQAVISYPSQPCPEMSWAAARVDA